MTHTGMQLQLSHSGKSGKVKTGGVCILAAVKLTAVLTEKLYHRLENLLWKYLHFIIATKMQTTGRYFSASLNLPCKIKEIQCN